MQRGQQRHCVVAQDSKQLKAFENNPKNVTASVPLETDPLSESKYLNAAPSCFGLVGVCGRHNGPSRRARCLDSVPGRGHILTGSLRGAHPPTALVRQRLQIRGAGRVAALLGSLCILSSLKLIVSDKTIIMTIISASSRAAPRGSFRDAGRAAASDDRSRRGVPCLLQARPTGRQAFVLMLLWISQGGPGLERGRGTLVYLCVRTCFDFNVLHFLHRSPSVPINIT